MSKKTMPLLDDEHAMIAELEAGGYAPVKNEAAEIQRYTEIFRESGTKIKRVNIRMTTRDVEKAQAVALREGIPYATLLTNILHQYFTGRLKEV
ncbi:MAG: hypothetical protein KBD83_08420 [Gammaproteobacteria bacterium]|nr:hypothetical protein [Gammaproteobacteria bacterium]